MTRFWYKLGAIFFGLFGFLCGFYFLTTFFGSESSIATEGDVAGFLTVRICLFLITVASFVTFKYLLDRVK